MNIGAELRDARQRAGLSPEQVSQRTKIQLAKIDALEANAFERLPDGIYLDGLIRAYANEVGLDGSEMVARLRRQDAAPVDDDFEDAADVAPPVVAAATPVPDHDPVLHRDPDLLDYSARPLADEPLPSPGVPPSAAVPRREPRRAGRYLIPVLALLGAIGLGAYLYDRNRPFATGEEIAAPAISHDNTSADAATAGRTADPPASDIIPADRPASTEHHAEEKVKEPEVEPPLPPSARAETTRAEAARGERSPREAARADSVPAPVPADPSAAAPPGNPEPTETRTAAAAEKISGSWRLDTRIESSSVQDYHGLQLGYRLNLQQSGNRVVGEGKKTLENGKRIAEFAQTPILVTGTIDGDRLTLTFTERGRRRESAGKMILDVHEDGVLRGRFSSSAARSSGTAEARRPEG